MLEKLTSRKFWTAIAGVIVGVAIAFGADGDEIASVAGAVTSLVSIVTYILAEASVDTARIDATIIDDSNSDDSDDKEVE